MGYRVERVLSRAVSSWSRSPGGCAFRGVLGWGGFFSFFFSFLFLGTHTADCKYEATLPHVPLLVMRLFFAFRNKSLFIPGCVQGAII